MGVRSSVLDRFFRLQFFQFKQIVKGGLVAVSSGDPLGEWQGPGIEIALAMIHVPNRIADTSLHGAGQAEGKIQYCSPYDLPYRALLPKGIEGLLVAGRCISGTHRAHASYRVMSICMAMGEAAGIAAALSAKAGCTPRQLDVAQLQEVMTDVGIQLFE